MLRTKTLLLACLLSLALAACGGSSAPESGGAGPPPPAPTASLAANPTSVASGGSSMLTWSSTNATSCSASGAWSGSKATSGSQSSGVLTTTSTFSLACTGAGGTASASAIVAVTTGTPSYTTNFDLTENPISEGSVWRRANNAWTNVRTSSVNGGIAFGTNGALNTYDDSYALLTGFGPDQQAQAVVFRSPGLVTDPNTTHEMELLLRFSDDASNARGYECLFNYAGLVEIVRWNGPLGNFTSLPITGPGNLGRDLVSGDVIKATIVGNVISLYINGVLRAQASDSTFATGQPGIGFFTRPAGVADNVNFGMTSYTVTSN